MNTPEQGENQALSKAKVVFREITSKLRLILRRGIFHGYRYQKPWCCHAGVSWDGM